MVSEAEDSRMLAGPATNEHLTREEFQSNRLLLPVTVGKLSEVKETQEEFAFNVVLSETPSELRIASYVVPKVPWDDWWRTAHLSIGGDEVTATASQSIPLPSIKIQRIPNASGECGPNDVWLNGVLDDPPQARTSPRSVWTGSLMIVWGGEGSTTLGLNTGARYDPATDTWTPTSTVGAPAPRTRHTVVWTGSEMIVWGGAEWYDPIYNTGARYDPMADSWTPMTTLGAPSARCDHSAVWTGSEMIVWGGEVTTSGMPPTPAVATTLSTNAWLPTSTEEAPGPNEEHGAAWTGSVMLIWSSWAGGSRYDPVTDSWQAISDVGAPSYRGWNTATWTGSELVVWGGTDGSNDYAGMNTGARYDPVADSWAATSIDGAPAPRYRHTAVWSGTELLVWGGRSGQSTVFNDGGRYDPRFEHMDGHVECGRSRCTGERNCSLDRRSHDRLGGPLVRCNEHRRALRSFDR
jgi:N-acetylneuraminic acid mutarotase